MRRKFSFPSSATVRVCDLNHELSVIRASWLLHSVTVGHRCVRYSPSPLSPCSQRSPGWLESLSQTHLFPSSPVCLQVTSHRGHKWRKCGKHCFTQCSWTSSYWWGHLFHAFKKKTKKKKHYFSLHWNLKLLFFKIFRKTLFNTYISGDTLNKPLWGCNMVLHSEGQKNDRMLWPINSSCF